MVVGNFTLYNYRTIIQEWVVYDFWYIHLIEELHPPLAAERTIIATANDTLHRQDMNL